MFASQALVPVLAASLYTCATIPHQRDVFIQTAQTIASGLRRFGSRRTPRLRPDTSTALELIAAAVQSGHSRPTLAAMRRINRLIQTLSAESPSVTPSASGRYSLNPIEKKQLIFMGLSPDETYTLGASWSAQEGLRLHFVRDGEALVYGIAHVASQAPHQREGREQYAAHLLARAPDLVTALLPQKERIHRLVLMALSIDLEDPDPHALRQLTKHLKAFKSPSFYIQASPQGYFITTPISGHRLFVRGLTPHQTYAVSAEWVDRQGLVLFFTRKNERLGYAIERYRPALTEQARGPQSHHYLERVIQGHKQSDAREITPRRLAHLVIEAMRTPLQTTTDDASPQFTKTLSDFRAQPFSFRSSRIGMYTAAIVGHHPSLRLEGLTGSHVFTIWPEWERPYGLRFYALGASQVFAYDVMPYLKVAQDAPEQALVRLSPVARGSTLAQARANVLQWEFRRRLAWETRVFSGSWGDPRGHNVPDANPASDPESRAASAQLKERLLQALTTNGYTREEVRWLKEILLAMLEGTPMEAALEESSVPKSKYAWVKEQFTSHIPQMLKAFSPPRGGFLLALVGVVFMPGDPTRMMLWVWTSVLVATTLAWGWIVAKRSLDRYHTKRRLQTMA